MAMTNSLNIKAKYKVSDLIEALLKNKEEHVSDYEKAIEVYKKDLLDLIEKPIAQLERGELPDEIEHNFGLVKPLNEAKNYDNMLYIFNSMTDGEVELSMSDANSILNDEWSWAINAKHLNNTYSSRG